MNRFVIAIVVAAIAGVGTVSALFAAGTLTPGSSLTSVVRGDQSSADAPWIGMRVVRSAGGLTVAAVIADSPAEKAGLKRGDVIKSIDGTAVSDLAGLKTALKDKKVGDSLKLSITRDGNAQDVTVTLEARPAALPIDNPIFPELNGIPRDQVFSHLLGGSFQFTDASGNTHTAAIELGTVSAVDTSANTLTVTLNSGGSKTYNITSDVHIRPQLSDFQNGDKVTAISVDGTLRAVTKGGHFLPFFGGDKHRGFRHHGGSDFKFDGAPDGADSAQHALDSGL